MTLVAVSGNDHDILVRWSDMAHQLGHESVILPPASLLGRPQLGSSICLYDLGRRRGANPQILIDAVEACPDTHFVAMTPHPDPHGLRAHRPERVRVRQEVRLQERYGLREAQRAP